MRRVTELRDPRSFDHVGRDRGAHFVAGDVLAELADTDERIVCGTADLKYVTQMEAFADRHPERFFEFGISERNMLSAAAGMASCGLMPYMSTFACFSAILCYEVIRTDHAYPHLPVRVLATHSGISMGFFGTSHHATEDISALRAVAGLTVLSPSDRYSVEALIRATVDLDGPIYFRMGRGQEADLYDRVPEDYVARSPYEVRPGGDVVLVSTGVMVRECEIAAVALEAETGTQVGVLDVHTLKPFPTNNLVTLLGRACVVVVIEEHNVEGGLGTMVTEALALAGHRTTVYKHGLLDEFALVGPPSHLYAYYGLDATGIATVLRRALEIGSDAPDKDTSRLLWTDEDRAAILASRRGA